MKILNGYVPTLTYFGNITTLKTDFVVTDSSQAGRGFVPVNAFNGFYADETVVVVRGLQMAKPVTFIYRFSVPSWLDYGGYL